ncbi:putative MPP superfamily phosphohydrolase [Parabacteroides sp. PF5-5]|uniref:metallophosphoesterase n=1 Tax=unclassified Parabacteroides TaxID=2649774 RepID=UPI0024740D9D|nr:MULTISPECIES: metallophosphoesterase [unclassified Parabacteroides]MDH6306239.1 putative MPP superfamily phosphohydrolase [Parabacteroides sp. PH5-39]MDH6316969.1 putative MPP superfamily phosphohydrolase [Parabacteroides sp. PF5-13]MDH6321039.1 putative MPP superfamily phosphohydrolase [Parabacteroides sp. PH5-13]MDH6324771.1 putative MPP superfamily phosphohydrolase [Parabacteroides sp. PH5-8]MDH6328154.1 putative MPP superfamily phosphohydrolase [Parabacteroides sp. PH5-41]
MKVFFGSIIAQLLLNPYVFWRGWQAIPAKKSWRVPYILFFAIELLVFFVGFFFHKLLPDDVIISILYYCGTWYIYLIYLTMALLLIEVVRLSNRYYPWYPKCVTAHWGQTKLALFFAVIISVGGLMIHAYHKVANPVVKHVHLTMPKGTSERDSLKIVMMTDLHIGEIINKRMVQKYVTMSNEQHPDLVVMVGDLMDYESRFAEQMHAEDDLRQLQAPLGVFAVLGNHEYRANRFAKLRWIRKTGATLLVDSVALVDNSFYIIGRDDYINKTRQPLRYLTKELDPTKPAILLDHQPWTFAEATMNGIDLGLYGHTHFGQIWPYPLLMKLIYECPYGYYRKGDSQFYVSSGIGIAGPPYRVGTVSEMVVLHIRFE